eukprot:6101971-Amphidinium_carterae.1
MLDALPVRVMLSCVCIWSVGVATNLARYLGPKSICLGSIWLCHRHQVCRAAPALRNSIPAGAGGFSIGVNLEELHCMSTQHAKASCRPRPPRFQVG